MSPIVWNSIGNAPLARTEGWSDEIVHTTARDKDLGRRRPRVSLCWRSSKASTPSCYPVLSSFSTTWSQSSSSWHLISQHLLCQHPARRSGLHSHLTPAKSHIVHQRCSISIVSRLLQAHVELLQRTISGFSEKTLDISSTRSKSGRSMTKR